MTACSAAGWGQLGRVLKVGPAGGRGGARQTRTRPEIQRVVDEEPTVEGPERDRAQDPGPGRRSRARPRLPPAAPTAPGDTRAGPGPRPCPLLCGADSAGPVRAHPHWPANWPGKKALDPGRADRQRTGRADQGQGRDRGPGRTCHPRRSSRPRTRSIPLRPLATGHYQTRPCRP